MDRGGTARPGKDQFEVARRAFSRIAMPVTIVAAAHDGERSCATGTTMYVSLAPARIAIAEYPGSRTTRLIRASGEFSVSLLREAQLDLAIAAGRSAHGPDKLAALGIEPVAPPAGLSAPGVAGAAAILWCRVRSSVDAGDHLLFVGEVVADSGDDDPGRPLLRFGRRYMGAGDALSEESPEGYPV